MNENVLDLKSLQNKLLELAEYFDLFCKENDIKYYLMGGTALGAIRHKGFIPWDDDFDVFMDSRNYKKFCNIIKYKLDKEKYFFQKHDTEENPLWFSKIRINNTTLIEKDTKDRRMHQGIFMDVMCLYNTPSNIVIRYAQYVFARILSAKALSEKGYLTNSNLKKIYIKISKYFISNSIKRNLYSFVNRFNGEKSKMVGHLFGRTPFRNSSFKREILGEPRYVQFEHLQLPVPQYAEDYLKITFGEDFMEIPTREERDKYPSHAFIVDIYKSYKFYMSGFINWRKYNGAMIPILPPDSIIKDTVEEIKSYISNNNAWFARWTTDFDSSEQTNFWYIIKDKCGGLEELSHNTRKSIKKGLRNVEVRMVTEEIIIKEGYQVYKSAFERYDNKHNMGSESQFIENVQSLINNWDFWGVFAEDKLVGYSQNRIGEGFCDYSSTKFHPDYLKLRISDVLFYTMTNYYLNELKLRYISAGTRSILHETNIQKEYIRKFKFRKAYCKLHIIYSPFLSIIIKIIYPFRNLLKNIRNKSIRKIYALLFQEEIRRKDCKMFK